MAVGDDMIELFAGRIDTEVVAAVFSGKEFPGLRVEGDVVGGGMVGASVLVLGKTITF